MKKAYWFKAKNFGWGWYPYSWQGWIVLLIYFIGVILNAYQYKGFERSDILNLIPFIVQEILLTTLLIIICFRTGEKPEWRWGKKKTTL